MIDIDTIEKTFDSSLAPSMERVVDLLKKSLSFFSELKNQFLSDNPKEKEHAIRVAQVIFARINEEIHKTCEVLGIKIDVFDQQIISFFSPIDAERYVEATEFIRAHKEELFSPLKATRPINLKAKQRLNAPRVFC